EMRLDSLVAALRAPLEAGVGGDIDDLLAKSVSPRRRARARVALLSEHLEGRAATGCWLIRSSPGADLGHLARGAHLPYLSALLLLAHAAGYALVLLSWWAVAKGALDGHYDTGWLAAWLLLLLSTVPFQLVTSWAASRITITAGTLLKTRLLMGALRLEPNETRHEGAGRLLSRVIESSSVEAMGLSGGLVSLVALVELVVCAAILAQGSAGPWHAALLVLFMVVLGALGARYYRRRQAWTSVRLSMTHDLVERLVGHRTRIAQEPRARWHDVEDQALERYQVVSRDLDRSAAAMSLVPRCWLPAGIAALSPAIMTGTPATIQLAFALGGVLLAYGALHAIVQGLTQCAGAAIAWHQAGPLVRAAGRAATPSLPSVTIATAAERKPGVVLIDAQDLRFRYGERGDAVLRGCSLRVAVGDRILLEGPSGGGKSTLGSVLAGVRAPQSGLLLLDGLDRYALGDAGWRRRVVAAPQFHENHVFCATFAFNLLLGRDWPPSAADLEEARAVCEELGLGPLLKRMPAGLQQVVGETGWQLSHGERSRMFIARALLQRADLVVLDESFAALDPESLQRALGCTIRRAPTLLVIAHP
ncbi:MAG TPA: ABC transporter ATP-binding protein, partial [Steroidobacteraceae bacterium]|nr:ABC transporter ATP-binding protein [Steroidobacteraceae bacterium]